MFIINMEDILRERAKNYYIIASIAEKKGMYAESISNYFKSLFALCDFILYKKIKQIPKDHSERFSLLKINDKYLYSTLDVLFSTYRETYTKILNIKQVIHVKEKIKMVFEYAKINIPTQKNM
ncbi:MAG: hypothetical protein AB1465_07245 [Patescibacteria group bacterium]